MSNIITDNSNNSCALNSHLIPSLESNKSHCISPSRTTGFTLYFSTDNLPFVSRHVLTPKVANFQFEKMPTTNRQRVLAPVLNHHYMNFKMANNAPRVLCASDQSTISRHPALLPDQARRASSKCPVMIDHRHYK